MMKDDNILIMTPGPTTVRENVRMARAKATTNPDIDQDFYDFYKELCDKIGRVMNTKNEVRVLCGEGILGLEAACASLTQKGDRVLIIDNGIFGEGFAEFVTMYGGEAVFFKGDRKRAINVKALAEFLNKDSRYKYATVVHCDTPSGILNDVGQICRLLKSKGILTIVDSVAAMGGEEIRVDDWCIDIALGGSQKCISAPPGLTFLSISQEAFSAMEGRETPVASFYCNLLIWKDYYKNKWFPYTMPISDIVGLNTAFDNIIQEGIENVIDRHHKIAEAVRSSIKCAGLNLYLDDGFSSTVTAVTIPEGIDDTTLRNYMKKHFNILIGGSIGYLNGKVIRIGHMGENAAVNKVSYTLMALSYTLKHFGLAIDCNMAEIFLQNIKEAH